jgi:acid phosphatase
MARLLLRCSFVLAIVALGCDTSSSGGNLNGGGGGGGGGGSGGLPLFGHAVIVLEENHNADQVDTTSMPYLMSLVPKGGLATQYYANTHPSIGNYLMLTTGQIVTNSDSYSQTISVDNIVRSVLAKGKTWKGYAEDLPSVGFTGQSSGKYARKHFPLSFFSDVVNDSTQIRNLVPFTQFATDLTGGTLPDYAFIAPNLCNDAHDCSLQTADAWLKTNIAPLLADPAFQADGLLIITFDESDTDNTHGGGRVFWLALGPKVKPGYSSTTLYQEENTLRLMAQGLGLTDFPGAAATASNMSEFFTP